MPQDDLPDHARFFSLEEARRMLPLVRRIVEDIVAQYQAMEPLMARYNALPVEARKGGRGRSLRMRIEEGADRIDELVEELHQLGCSFKGLREGLVDWYSYYAGRPVFLCWKLGEEEIAWWHQLDAGFVGRQPIPDSQQNAFRAEPDRA